MALHPYLFKRWRRREIVKIDVADELSEADRLAQERVKTNPQHTYSQLGEDIAIIHHLGHQMGGRYIDIGCYHPFTFSNTALLHINLQWSGLNIDADWRAIEAFCVARPNDINLNLAVGLEDREIDFAVFEEGAVNSAAPEDYEAKRTVFGDPVMRRIRMLPLQNIVELYLPEGETFDFLNVDVEGLDLQVLQSLDWEKHRPKVVAVEIHGLVLDDSTSSATVRFMKSVGYRLCSFSVVTAIFVRQAL